MLRLDPPAHNPELRVEVALAHAPVTKGYPAITPDFLAMLHHRGATWEPQGIRVTQPNREPFCSFLTPWAASKRGAIVWWLGDSAARCTCSPGDFAALLKGRALKDGSIMAGGEAKRLHYHHGWAYLVPRSEASPVEVRRHLVTLSNNVLGFVGQMDALMPQPSTVEKGKAIAKLLNALDMANQSARYFGLDVKGSAKMMKMLPGGTR